MKIVVNNKNNERLDKYLSEHLDYSRSIITKMIEQNDIVVNGNPTKASYKIKLGDTIEIIKEYVATTDIEPTPMELNIVYEDEYIIIINKPNGVVVHPGSGNETNTLANGLLYYTQHLSDLNGEERPGIVHRLDKDTSGLMLIAKTNQSHTILSEEFKKHNVKREYVALLNGILPHNKAKIDAPIGRDKQNRKKMAVTAENSKNAVTHLTVLKRYKKHTLVNLALETGRTHQIRVHMNYIGYPVFNDPVYAHQVIKEYGQFLHSKNIDFVHPITKEKMHFESDLPAYFREYIDTLEEEQD